MTTGGRGLTAEMARAAKEAGMWAVSVSVDGSRETHDRLRGVKGSYDAAFNSLRYLRDAGIHVATNTQINFSAGTWRAVANEANMLANRIHGRTSSWRSESRSAARDLRMHVREMRAAALKGDAAGARTHAAEALPFASTLANRIRGTV